MSDKELMEIKRQRVNSCIFMYCMMIIFIIAGIIWTTILDFFFSKIVAIVFASIATALVVWWFITVTKVLKNILKR